MTGQMTSQAVSTQGMLIVTTSQSYSRPRLVDATLGS